MAAADFRVTGSIALIGLMGAGKSSVGPRLADRLDLPFADSDAEVEWEAGLGVIQIFARFGEEDFRERERQVIAELVDDTPKVIAVGGGAFQAEGTRRLLLERCTVVWLDAGVETLVARLASAPARPLLRGRDPHAALAQLAEERRPAFSMAHHRIDADAPLDAVVERVLGAVGARA